MYLRGFGVEIAISTKACSCNRAETAVFLLEIAGLSFECERFVDGFYFRLNRREWSVWT